MKRSFSICIHFLFVLALLLTAAGTVMAQENPPQPIDSTNPPSAPVDTLGADTTRADSLSLTTNRSGLDTVVVYSARDSTVFDLKSRIMRLYGDAVVVKGPQKLTAAYIEIDFVNSTLHAEALYDSATRRYVGVPVFRDGTEELSANSLTYNFRTRRGTLGAAETRFQDGFYYGQNIKRVDENTLFVEDGRYTTCDAPHPHYFFSSPKMKVEVGDRIFADQVALNVADVPIFYIPFGIFFASRGGKQSGIIIPRWGQNAQRGFTLEGLGFFWAGTEHIDSRLDVDLYSKGGYTFRNNTRYALRGVIDVSNLNLTYSRTRDDPDEELTSYYIAGYQHQMRLGRRSRLGGNLNFAARNAIRGSSTRAGDVIDPRTGQRISPQEDITTQLVTSDFSYSTSWDWGGSLSSSFRRSQNIISDELDVSVPVSFSLPTFTPFSGTIGILEPFESLSLGYSGSATAQWIRRDTIPGGGFRTRDNRIGATHRPTIGISPKFGFFSFQPSFNYTESWFTRRALKQTVGDTVLTSFISGFRRAYSWSAGLSVSTKMYGIVQPRILGVNAIRHTIAPTIGISYSPDFGKPEYGFFDEVFNPRTNAIDRYSIFEADASVASAPGQGLQQLITLDLRNDFEAKIAQGDTLEDKKVRLLSVGLNTSYNAAAFNNIRWNTINMDVNTDLGTIGSLGGNMRFNLYDVDSTGRILPELLIRKGKGPVRIESAYLSFRTRLTDQGFTTGTGASAVADSAAARRERFNFEQVEFDEREFFGEEVHGTPAFRIPWEVNIGGSYDVRSIRPGEMESSFNMNMDFNFSLTPTTRITSGGQYNFELGKFLIPTVGLEKDLHCWEMRFSWQPSGFSRGFYFSIGLKSPQLSDIKFEQQQRSF